MVTVVDLTEWYDSKAEKWDFYLYPKYTHTKNTPVKCTKFRTVTVSTVTMTIEAFSREDGSLLWSGEEEVLKFIDYLDSIQKEAYNICGRSYNSYNSDPVKDKCGYLFIMDKEILEYFDRIGEYQNWMVYDKDGKLFTLPNPE